MKWPPPAIFHISISGEVFLYYRGCVHAENQLLHVAKSTRHSINELRQIVLKVMQDRRLDSFPIRTMIFTPYPLMAWAFCREGVCTAARPIMRTFSFHGVQEKQRMIVKWSLRWYKVDEEAPSGDSSTAASKRFRLLCFKWKWIERYEPVKNKKHAYLPRDFNGNPNRRRHPALRAGGPRKHNVTFGTHQTRGARCTLWTMEALSTCMMTPEHNGHTHIRAYTYTHTHGHTHTHTATFITQQDLRMNVVTGNVKGSVPAKQTLYRMKRTSSRWGG